jgi:hypothetical protein
MKKNLQLIILIAMLFITAFAKAQTSGGPDEFGYTWRNSFDLAGPIYNWVDISSRPGTVRVIGLQDDNIKGPFSLAIPFTYYWYNPNKFWIGSNGYIGFTSNAVAAPFPFIPNLNTPNDWMAAMASDLTLTDINVDTIPGTRCMYWQSIDSLIVTWENVPFWDPSPPGYTGNNTFQIILTTIDSSITYQYFDQTGIYTANPTNFMEVGIENNSGSIGLEVNHDTYPTPGLAIKFYYPDSIALAINDASTFYVQSAGSKGVILSRNVSSFTSIAAVKNTGNQLLPSFDSESRIVNALSQIQVRDTVTVTNLAPGATHFITYPDLWTPIVTGVFRDINTTHLTGDATPSNDVDTLEMWVIDPTVASISLQWDNGVSSGTALSWLGNGGSGVAQHFVPSFYPCAINAVGALVASDLNNVGFSLQVFADDGPGGSPLTELDSIFVLPGSFTPGVYYEVSTTTTLPINSGGFYVVWMMGGASVSLGQDATTPHAHQSWEVLGPASNPANWAAYRDQGNDPIIHAIITNTTNVHNVVAEPNHFGEFYPNPARYKTSLQYNLKDGADLKFSLYNLEGKLISEKQLGKAGAGDGSIEINLQNYAAGSYVCKITAGDREYHKKITILR